MVVGEAILRLAKEEEEREKQRQGLSKVNDEVRKKAVKRVLRRFIAKRRSYKTHSLLSKSDDRNLRDPFFLCMLQGSEWRLEK